MLVLISLASIGVWLYTGCTSVLIVGGVGCNVRLQEMMQVMLRQRVVAADLCAMDNRCDSCHSISLNICNRDIGMLLTYLSLTAVQLVASMILRLSTIW